LPAEPAHHDVRTNGVRLHVVQAGPEAGTLAVLLHGFPEFWYGWRRQIEPLAAAGYRVWAPDQRGYNTSDKPAGIAAYSLDTLAADAIGLIDAAGQAKAVLIGHDWGAAVAWWAALTAPERVRRLVVMNVPHPLVMQRQLRRNMRQLLRSWYIFAFQLPWLPELFARRRNWRAVERAMRATSRPGTFSEADFEEYRAAWSQPGAYTAMVNWYRAALRRRPKSPASVRVTVPTLMIWGARDRFLGRELAQPSIELCDRGRLVFLDDATHWVQHEEPEEVNRLVLDFLREPR
jgi:pimeloyl-ACP methyl ester carboxylesterase